MKVVDNSLSFQSILNHLNWTSVAQDIPKTLRGAQTRIRDTVRAGDPCALIFSHTVHAKGPVHIDFVHTLRADMNMTRVGDFSP